MENKPNKRNNNHPDMGLGGDGQQPELLSEAVLGYNSHRSQHHREHRGSNSEHQESTSLNSPSYTSDVFRRLPSTSNNNAVHIQQAPKHEQSPSPQQHRGNILDMSSARHSLEHTHDDNDQRFHTAPPDERGDSAFARHKRYRRHPPPPPPPPNHYQAASSSDRYTTLQESTVGPPLPPPYYHHGMPVVHANGTHSSSSFESHASSSATAAPTVVRSNASAPMMAYSSPAYGPIPTLQQRHNHHPATFAPYPYYPPPPPSWTLAPPPPPPPPPIELVHDLNKSDVLCGRGGATNSHTGNRAFRNLVKKYQDRYLRAKKRDKPAVASIIVEVIRKNGGRFLRRSENSPQGQTFWVEIEIKKATEKTCQALREGAPEIRRKSKTGSSDDDESRDSPRASLATNSSGSPMATNATTDNQQLRNMKKKSPQIELVLRKSDDENLHWSGRDDVAESPIIIRPIAMLMQRRKSDAIALDDLSEHERNLYLQDFLPPRATSLRNAKRNVTELFATHGYISSENDNNDDTSPWPVVSV